MQGKIMHKDLSVQDRKAIDDKHFIFIYVTLGLAIQHGQIHGYPSHVRVGRGCI